ncbi:MAG: hypothetical protein OEO21_00955, partial [Candidatus Krumholzibacteria bacterium]|nr:hypothetical protein [Candidatus Krumholzibacteria bacterium]
FLDKFMVATAFSLGLAAMAAAWYAASAYMASRARHALVLVFASVIGMLGFHSLVGFVTLVAIGGGVVLLALSARGTSGYAPRAGLALLATAVAGFLVMTPYLYSVMHLKETEQVIPFGLSLRKTGGIVVSCALALVLLWRQRAFLARRDATARFVLYASLSVTAFCLVIQLPGFNTYDKLAFFVYFPLAVVAGWSLADFVERRKTPRARRLSAVAVSAVCFLPVNGLAFAACFATPPAAMVTPDELRLSAWVRDHTPREAVFIDDDDRVVLLVTGPRRYFWGCMAYAQMWGYDKLEMSERYHVRRALYGDGALDATTLEKLGSVSYPLYAVRRGADNALARHPQYFAPIADFGSVGLVRIDTHACREAARDPSLPTISREDLLRESGL